MKYIQVKWRHSNPNDPVILCSELSDDAWELRKVEVFGDGRCGFASEAEAYGGTWLSIEPIPPLHEIAADPEFEAIEITASEFEQVWIKRWGTPNAISDERS